jgi:hypothetical protein
MFLANISHPLGRYLNSQNILNREIFQDLGKSCHGVRSLQQYTSKGTKLDDMFLFFHQGAIE